MSEEATKSKVKPKVTVKKDDNQPKIPIRDPTFMWNTQIYQHLSEPIAAQLAKNIETICLKNTFTVSGHDLTWKRISKKVAFELDQIFDEIKKPPKELSGEEEAEEWRQKQVLNLCYEGMNEEVYQDLDIGAIQMLIRAPLVRQRGFFLQE